jgi:hypothetical protein
MTSIILNSITGLNYPYDIYVCDVYGNNCGYISQINTPVPASVEIVLPPPFNMAPAVGIKIITSDGCERFRIIECIYLTPTPTPSITPTNTPTVTSTPLNCTIWDWELYTSGTTASIDYYNCDNVFTTLPITSSPSSGNICVYPLTTPVWNPPPGGSYLLGTSGVVCLSPSPTPTPTNTVTPTQTPTNTSTPTPTPTPIYYLEQADGFYILQADGSKIIIT